MLKTVVVKNIGGGPVEGRIVESPELSAGILAPAARNSVASTHLRFLFYLGALIVLFAFPLWALFLLGGDNHYTHTLVIAPAAAYLFWTDRRRLFVADSSARGVTPAALGLTGLAFALLAVTLGSDWQPVNRLSLQILSFVLLTWAGFLWCYGRDGFFRALFPMLFLILMVPFPTMMLDKIVAILQHGTADMCEPLFRVTGTVFFREGTVFYIPGLAIDIAPECSGIRSSMALLITGLVASYWFLRRWWSRGILWALILPLAIFKNGVRIVSLCLLTMHVDPGFLDGPLHTRGGFVFFLIALAEMGLILLALRWAERRG